MDQKRSTRSLDIQGRKARCRPLCRSSSLAYCISLELTHWRKDEENTDNKCPDCSTLSPKVRNPFGSQRRLGCFSRRCWRHLSNAFEVLSAIWNTSVRALNVVLSVGRRVSCTKSYRILSVSITRSRHPGPIAKASSNRASKESVPVAMVRVGLSLGSAMMWSTCLAKHSSISVRIAGTESDAGPCSQHRLIERWRKLERSIISRNAGLGVSAHCQWWWKRDYNRLAM